MFSIGQFSGVFIPATVLFSDEISVFFCIGNSITAHTHTMRRIIRIERLGFCVAFNDDDVGVVDVLLLSASALATMRARQWIPQQQLHWQNAKCLHFIKWT